MQERVRRETAIRSPQSVRGARGWIRSQRCFVYGGSGAGARGRFYELLKEESGKTIFIDGGYPVDQQENLADLLKAAEHNEKEEFEEIYPAFAEIAKQEGFFEAASAFLQIAEIEHVHQKRFGKVAKMLQTNQYYAGEEPKKWICTNCGYIHEGKQAPKYVRSAS